MKRNPGTTDSIAAIATPLAESALAVIRTSGENSIDLLAGVFSEAEKLINALGHTLVRGTLLGRDGEILDEVVAAVFRRPRSYTGQNAVELFCHGSPVGVIKVMERLREAGFRDADPGEFTLRAFLNGKLDLTEAEAVNEIISAKSRKAQEMAIKRLSGAIEKPLAIAKEDLMKAAAAIELSLDYPDDEIEVSEGDLESLVTSARNRLATVASTYRAGRILQEGAVVVLTGPTNVGKSSLFNLFLKEDRSIVSEIHGTTRDYIESWIQIDGIPIRLIDTAGVREADHPLEAEGIRRTQEIVDTSDIVVYMVDGSAESADFEVARPLGDREIRVWHKADIAPGKPPVGCIPVSSVTGEGFSSLEEAIKGRIAGEVLFGNTAANAIVIDSYRQKELLDRAVEALTLVMQGLSQRVALDAVSLDLKEALDCIGEITGEITTADVLNQIFSNFCVGK